MNAARSDRKGHDGDRDRPGRPSMSLRARLVLALVGLLAAGLVVYGVTTYQVQSRRDYARLDDRLRGTVIEAGRSLTRAAGLGDTGNPPPGGNGGIGGDGDGGPDGEPVFGTYAELRDATGGVVTTQTPRSGARPALPTTVPVDRAFTTGAASGGGEWRVLLTDEPRHPGYQVLIAVPTTDVAQSLRGLLYVEWISAAVLLSLLGAGSWLIVRRGLRPLEHMADTARSINAGDLSLRVSPADGAGEVGQLGLALNSMLGEIEVAFRERQETEHRLRQFLADASHELRTPLTSIQGFAELYRLGVDNEHVDRTVIMRRIEEESARMKRLVEDLLTLARLDRTHDAAREPVDLAVLAADACSDAVAADPTRPVSLDAPAPVIVDGVRDHLRQAVANLVANAVKHTPAGTPIELRAVVEGTDAVLVVRDHGAGLDAAALDHAFDRFWQADAARVGTGSGLGLSIVAGIATEHGGTVRAENATDGGAQFTVRLPARHAG